ARNRVVALEPNPIDKAAITMAAEAVNSIEPIRSMFISYSFLFDYFLFVQSVGASCAPEPTLRGARRRQLRLIIHLSSQKISWPAPWDGTAG
ncbi:MAG: hypothetical protein DME75_05085, partial [Verrucomicrobia bacterium]